MSDDPTRWSGSSYLLALHVVLMAMGMAMITVVKAMKVMAVMTSVMVRMMVGRGQ